MIAMKTSGRMASSAVSCFRRGPDDLTLLWGLYDRARVGFELARPVISGV